MKTLLTLWRCTFAVPYRNFNAARHAQVAFSAHGVKSTLENCQWCGKWHLKSR